MSLYRIPATIGYATVSELDEFIKYLKERELSICNFTRNGVGYWHVDMEAIVNNFRKKQGHGIRTE